MSEAATDEITTADDAFAVAKKARGPRTRRALTDLAELIDQLEAESEETQRDLKDAADEIGHLKSLLRTEDEYVKSRWRAALDLFDEAHRELGHESAVTLCSHPLCRRMTAVIETRQPTFH